GWEISNEAVREGARKLRWPGRLEVVGVRPWVVLDVAHNEPSAKALARALPGMVEYERLVAVVGLMGEKDAGAFCGTLAPLVEVVVLTQARNPRALPVGELEKACEGMWKRVVVTQSVPEAFEVAKAEAGVRDCVLVTGGLYVVGEVMEETGARGGRH
ncbi:MAG: cyanophycin synthetase, partial [Armatimonadia bacterium]